MHKLLILIELPEHEAGFETRWPEFISLTANIPGLRRETTSRIGQKLFGSYSCTLIHELYFDSTEALRQALNSPTGVEAGKILQRITLGRITLFLAEHLEDDPIRYASGQQELPSEEDVTISPKKTTS
jgi:uncharacterized protein (TIGR02118 family)